jgi:hypothetical protein
MRTLKLLRMLQNWFSLTKKTGDLFALVVVLGDPDNTIGYKTPFVAYPSGFSQVVTFVESLGQETRFDLFFMFL